MGTRVPLLSCACSAYDRRVVADVSRDADSVCLSRPSAELSQARAVDQGSFEYVA